MISFISVTAVMIYFVLFRIKYRSNLLIYSTGTTSPTATLVSWTAWSMPPRSPLSTATSARCRFGARRQTWCITPRTRATVTTGPWRINIKYEMCYPFTLPESLEDHRRLLVSEEDDSVFLLIVGTGESREGRRPISVVCVRGDAADADTDTRPMYGCVLSVTTPPGHVGGDTGYIKQTWTLRSEDLPADVDLENPWSYLPANTVHGDSKEVYLDICIIKLNVDH